uniref:TCP domain-containing protein n=1 Tax=Setaria viridis TaxID=4556 RepID=A0A4U6UL63_SETVI|nr:hypothetical protein SEVIR_5G333200v2 [Setaria viridis]
MEETAAWRTYRVACAAARGKDRHNKVVTVRGSGTDVSSSRCPRPSSSTTSRTASASTSPVKAIEWLIRATSIAIDELLSLNCSFALPGAARDDAKVSTSETSKSSVLLLTNAPAHVAPHPGLRACRRSYQEPPGSHHRWPGAGRGGPARARVVGGLGSPRAGGQDPECRALAVRAPTGEASRVGSRWPGGRPGRLCAPAADSGGRREEEREERKRWRETERPVVGWERG